MKAFRVVLALALVLAAFGFASGAEAQAFTYSSGFQVQNLEAVTATITITFYNPDGSQANQIGDSVPANGSKTYFPLNQVADGFNGSVVISSDKQVAAIGNILGDNGLAAASYSAATTGSNQVLIPLLMKDNSGYNTWFNVQNTGAGTATVTVAYSDGEEASASIEPGAAHTFNQSQETHSAKVFSAIVTSDEPIAATVIEENDKVMFAYSGFASGSTAPVLPLINANNAGYNTGVQIQNAGTADTVVTLSYTASPGAGTDCTETQTIAAGKSATFAWFSFAGASLDGMTTTCTGGARFVGSAKVSANSASAPLTVIVNQLSAINGEAYNGFAGGGETVVMPLIMDRYYGYFTGFNVQNIGSTTVDVECTFTGSTKTVEATLTPGQALNHLQANFLAEGYTGSATCTAPGGEIVAVVNEVGAATAADQLLVYEGVNP
jgi:hypothetical protein